MSRSGNAADQYLLLANLDVILAEQVGGCRDVVSWAWGKMRLMKYGWNNSRCSCHGTFYFVMGVVFGLLLDHAPLLAENKVLALETGPVAVDKSGENQAIRMVVDSYSLRSKKLGDPAPEGSLFFIIRGKLINKNTAKGASVPPVQKAFFLKLSENKKVFIDPISEDTADPFWGPLVLLPGEKLPVEMVFIVPAKRLEEASLMHLSNMGPSPMT